MSSENDKPELIVEQQPNVTLEPPTYQPDTNLIDYIERSADGLQDLP